MKPILVLSIAASMLTSACASDGSLPEPEPQTPWAGGRPTVVVVRRLEPPLGARTGDETLKIRVHMEGETAVAKLQPHGVMGGIATAGKWTGTMVGLGGIAVLFSGPAGASAAVVGTGFIVLVSPVLMAEGHRHAKQRDVVVKALADKPLPPLFEAALIRRLRSVNATPADAASTASPDTTRIDITIHTYGLTLLPPQRAEMLCVLVRGSVSVTSSREVEFSDDIVWEPYRRSEDLPAPQCADLRTFARQDGRLTRDSIDEAAEVLAAAVVKRLRGTP